MSFGFHPQSNGQTKRKNQETALNCLVSEHPACWSQQLLCMEYAHNTLTSSATGMSPLQCAYGFQPPLFSALENEVSCPSAQAFVRHCCLTWAEARVALLCSANRYSSVANCCRSKAPIFQVVGKAFGSRYENHYNIKLKHSSTKLEHNLDFMLSYYYIYVKELNIFQH